MLKGEHQHPTPSTPHTPYPPQPHPTLPQHLNSFLISMHAQGEIKVIKTDIIEQQYLAVYGLVFFSFQQHCFLNHFYHKFQIYSFSDNISTLPSTETKFQKNQI